MQVSDFYYELPEELIAQEPLPERGASRMLVISRESQSFHDDLFKNFSAYVHPGDCVVLNDSRVFPARLYGRRNTNSGARMEVFLIRSLNQEETIWSTLIRPGKRIRMKDEIIFDDHCRAEVLSEDDAGLWTLRFFGKERPIEIVERLGTVPLPPYIRRPPNTTDRYRYQTVFAKNRGSIAAPTAGLHFTPEMLEACRGAGAELAYITLHVGLGTFGPLRQERLADVRLHEEIFEISDESAGLMKKAKRLLCVGTTSMRTVETAILEEDLRPMKGKTSLFISPGFQFRGAGALLTNFHLPRSSLFMLVCAFVGTELTFAAYRHAVAEKYRFYSYGDCMLIE